MGIFCFKMAETTAFLCAGTKAPGEKKKTEKGKRKEMRERMNYWSSFIGRMRSDAEVWMGGWIEFTLYYVKCLTWCLDE